MINQHANFIVDLNLDKIQWQLPCGNHMVFKEYMLTQQSMQMLIWIENHSVLKHNTSITAHVQ